MRCAKPIEVLGHRLPVPCGQCIACRVNRQRTWVGRMILESFTGEGAFVTLTYEDAYIPKVFSEDGSKVYGDLVPHHVRSYLMKFRKLYGKTRYFAVGEYGSKTWRPHYHLIQWGHNLLNMQACVESAWPYGFVTVSGAEIERLRYIGRYTLKKMTRVTDIRLDGRQPEFSRMSLKPAIGSLGMKAIAAQLGSKEGMRWISVNGDIPYDYRIDGERYPIARYWRDWLRQELGIEKPPEDRKTEEEYAEESRAFVVDLEEAKRAAAKMERTLARHAETGGRL